MNKSSYFFSDYFHLRNQIESEIIENVDGQSSRPFLDLPKTEQLAKLKDRLRKYCQKVNTSTLAQACFWKNM